MKQVRLTHHSLAPGMEGKPGSILEVDDDMAARWEREGGCVILGDAAPKKRTASKDKPEVER